MTDLRTLRPYLDALADDALGRVLEDKPAPWARRRARVLLVAAAVVAILATAGAVAVTRSDTRSPEVTSTGPRPTTAIDPQRLSLTNPDCVATGTFIGCERTPSEASSMLGIEIETPTQIPEGWKSVRRVVRVYPSGIPPNDTPDDMAVYDQVWAPAGNIDPGSTMPKYVQLRERAVLPAEACYPTSRPLSLADGTQICGTIGVDSDNVPGALLSFSRGGVYFTLTSIGLTDAQVLDLLNSLTR